MKKFFLITVMFLFVTMGNACIGSKDPANFHASGTFLKSGHAWEIATMGDGKIHYMVYDGKGNNAVDLVLSYSDALYYTELFHLQGHGQGGDC